MAKKQITCEGDACIKSPEPPRAQENQLSKAMEYMVAEMSQRFRNQVLGELQAATIDEFEDAAQVGNYAAVYLRLARRVQRKLLKQFDDKRIEQLVQDITGRVNKRNQSGLYGLVEKRIGLSTKELTATEGLKPQINALALETSQWVKKLRDETLEIYTANSLRAMTNGLSLPEILKQFDGLEEKRKNHAKFTARNQIANFNSISTKLRAQNLGIEQARWLTSEDERVRPCHKVRNDKQFDLAKGLFSSCDGLWLLPGVDFQCRCTYELIIPED